MAQTTSTPPDALRPSQTASASVSHVMSKAITLNAAIAAVSMTIYSVGTGSLVAGGVLSAGSVLLGFTAYPINEYLWDTYFPNTNLSANNSSFDAKSSLWRNTGKYLTFKTEVVLSKFGLIYLYTGSLVASVAIGSVASLTLPVVFYANNMAWDWYDWHASVPTAADAPKPNVPQIR